MQNGTNVSTPTILLTQSSPLLASTTSMQNCKCKMFYWCSCNEIRYHWMLFLSSHQGLWISANHREIWSRHIRHNVSDSFSKITKLAVIRLNCSCLKTESLKCQTPKEKISIILQVVVLGKKHKKPRLPKYSYSMNIAAILCKYITQLCF